MSYDLWKRLPKRCEESLVIAYQGAEARHQMPVAGCQYLDGVFIYLMLPRPQVTGLIKGQVIRAQGIEFTFPGGLS